MKSIYLRNFFSTGLMVFICFLIIAASLAGLGRSYMMREYSEDMQNSANEIVRTAAAISETDSLNSWALKMMLSSISNSTGNQIFISDEKGVVVSCSDRAPFCEHIGMQIPVNILTLIDAGSNISQITNLEGLLETNRFVVAQRIVDDGDENVIGYVFVSNVIDNILEAWHTLLSIMAMVSLLVFAGALVASLAYSRSMARPLDEMAVASRKFARGDFSVRVKYDEDPSDEMGALIESFNKMADSLEKAEARRSEFIANISHELRTPMTVISGFADGILDGTIPHEDEEKYLTSIRDETRRLSRLVKDMLDVSQTRAKAADTSRRQVFDLTELMLQTLLSFEDRATKKKLDVDPQLPDNPLLVKADKDAITQVIYNLVDNAVKFSHEGGCLTVRLYKDNGKAYVAIRDEGETIPKDDLPFIFDRFHKSDRSRSLDKDGVGLGLYLVKTIINSHDEDIAVKSEDGITEFVFTLPVAE